MAWFNIEPSFDDNEVLGLWIRCGTYASGHRTAGFVPASVVAVIGSDPAVVERAIAAGFLERVTNGFRVSGEYLPETVEVQ